MSTNREIRRLAFQALYQLDARPDDAAEVVLASVTEVNDEGEHKPTLTSGEERRAIALATTAFAARGEADAFMLETAPEWPTHRQAAVDRAILRLAYYEMFHGETPPKVAVNEAVELAKAFSTEKSPSFINGLLDKALKKALAKASDAPSDADAPAIDVTSPEPNAAQTE